MAILPEKKIVDPSNAKKLAAEAQHLSRAADVVRKRAVGQLRYAKECRSTAEEASARFKARLLLYVHVRRSVYGLRGPVLIG